MWPLKVKMRDIPGSKSSVKNVPNVDNVETT